MEKAIQVFSEIGKLKKVLLHRPGQELEQLVPEYLDQLLFDDIPYLAGAQNEHDRFAETLRENGAEVLYLEDLVAETLAQSPEIKEQFVQEFIAASGSIAQHYQSELKELFLSLPERDLVLKSMAGVNMNELKSGRRGPLVESLAHKLQFVLDPIPNLYFTRDPFACIGGGVALNRMFSITRNRETIYGRYLLSYHPDYRGKVPLYYKNNLPFHIEGGDVLNLSASTLAVGISQRTAPEAIELLAANLFAQDQSQVDTILAFDIPNLRAYMHLDTVFTQVDVDKFTIHAGIQDTLQLYVLRKKGSKGEFDVEVRQDSLDRILAKYMGQDKVELINCGGMDRIASAREQWNDGANTLAIAPGVVVVYDRNNITNAILRDKGVTVLEVPSSELARGRGGPRCMSMPFWREAL